MIIFMWIFLKDAKFVIFSVDFLAWVIGIIRIKIQNSVACLEKKTPVKICIK